MEVLLDKSLFLLVGLNNYIDILSSYHFLLLFY